ncbi:MAG: hypothetical protein AMJ81_09145, partial [Phycisphaerae bacterium SM23_33]
AFLEVVHEGKLAAWPKQVAGVQAFHRSGQVFVTFEETEPPDAGKQRVTWAELGKSMKCDYYRPQPVPGRRELRYRVYCHDEPITPANVGRAELLAEVLPGSAFNTRYGLSTDQQRPGLAAGILPGEGKQADCLAVRVAVEPGKPLPPGTGLYVHTARRQGRFYYAVLSAADGVTNTVDISQANTAGPITQRPADPEPVLYKEFVTQARGAKFVQQWYSFWAVQPLSLWPARYDVVVGYCPELLAGPAPLSVVRSGWNSWPSAPQPSKTTGMIMSHTADQPVDFRTGLNDALGTLKGFGGGTWKPFHSNRQEALIKWMLAKWPVNGSRICASLGAWGFMEIYRGERYAFIRGWGLPELSKGFQSWQRACGIWGPPGMYRDRPAHENPFVVSNVTDWVLAHPEKELPYCYVHAGGGAHYTEMGWPPFPRFLWAMMKTKRAFVFSTCRSPVADAITAGRLSFRLDQSLPAFANCSLDDNVGEGDLRSGKGWNRSQINGYLLWDPLTITDQPDRWEITVWVDASAFPDDCTVDLTPRRCRNFKAKPGRKFTWTSTVLPEDKAGGLAASRAGGGTAHSGGATADEHGLVTLKTLKITKARHRITIKPAN